MSSLKIEFCSEIFIPNICKIAEEKKSHLCALKLKQP